MITPPSLWQTCRIKELFLIPSFRRKEACRTRIMTANLAIPLYSSRSLHQVYPFYHRIPSELSSYLQHSSLDTFFFLQSVVIGEKVKLINTIIKICFICVYTGLIKQMAVSSKLVVTIEENNLRGGFGESLAAEMAAMNLNTRVLNLGIPDRPIRHASRSEQLKECGLDVYSLVDAIVNKLNS